MALYVAICLLAALTTLHDDSDRLLPLVWGTTVGLAAAHWVAFRVSTRLVTGGAIGEHDAAIAGAQLVGAVAVATICTPIALLLPAAQERDVIRLELAAFLAVVGYTVASLSGASRARSIVYAGNVAVIALAVAIAKNLLAGH